jgi:PAS domain S-box-containing protein
MADNHESMNELRSEIDRLTREVARLRDLENLYHEVSSRQKDQELLAGRFQDIIEFLPDATFVVDRDGRVIAWNRATEEMTGVSKREILGQGDYAHAIPFYGQRRPMLIDLANQGDPGQSAEYDYMERKGRDRYAEVFLPGLYRGRGAYIWAVASPLLDRDGRVVGAIESIRDVTERKLMEEEHDLLAAAVENAVEMVVVVDMGGRVRYVNPAIAQSGYQRSEVIGRQLGNLVQEESSGGFAVRLMEAMARKATWSGRVSALGAGGERLELEATMSPIRDKKGRMVGYVAVARDITRELRLERQLRQSQKMEAIGTLAGGIAHDFNNILSSVMGYTELARRSLPQDSRAGLDLGEVMDAAHRAKELVQQILVFSREGEQEPRPLHVGSIVKEALKLLRPSLPSTIEIKVMTGIKHDVVMADPTQMHQVLINLCTNAAHAMGDQGGRMEVGLTEVELGPAEVLAYPDLACGPYLRLAVSDNGHGMKPAIMERIFDPFFTTKGRGEGTGMGLAVVHGIVRSHGGVITVESEPDKGTTFHIYLPRLDMEIESEEEYTKIVPHGQERILFVDDEAPVVEIWERALAGLGYRVTALTDSLKAFEVFKDAPDSFDLVITDQTMPGLTGAELAGKIMELRCDVPIILCTGFSKVMGPAEAKLLGIREFLMKPIYHQRMAEVIRQVLDAQPTAREE